jgi:hypothetical protein
MGPHLRNICIDDLWFSPHMVSVMLLISLNLCLWYLIAKLHNGKHG